MSLNHLSEQEYKKQKKQSIIDTTSDTMNVNKQETNGYNIVTLPADYKQKQKSDSKKLIQNKNDTFTKVYDALREDEKKNLKKYEAFQRNVMALAALLGEKLPMPKDEKNAKPEVALKNSGERLNEQCMVFSFVYNKLIMSIDGAIKESDEDEAQILNILKESCEKERDIFHDKVSQYQKRMIANPKEEPAGGSTWVDALEYVRCDVYDLDSRNYRFEQNFEGGSSEIFHLQNNNTGENLWFSKEHNIPPEKDTDMVKELLKEFDFSSMKKEQQLYLYEQLDNIYVRRNSNQKDQFILMLDELYFQHQNDPVGYINGLISKLGNEVDKFSMGFVEFLNDLTDAEKKEMYFLLDRFQRKVTTKNNASQRPTSAKIDYGKNLNKRDVATYRIANLFGVKDLFCCSRLACIKQKDKMIKGSVMENAKGQIFPDYIQNHTSMSFSTGALSQFAIIQVVDAICGQTDRHVDNMHAVISEKGDVQDIKCFDNNNCLGHKEYNEYMFKNWENNPYERGNSKPVNDDLIKALPMWFINRIYNMRLEGLTVMLCDVLDTKEIRSLWKRIKGIQEHIAKVFHEDYEQRKKEMEKGNYEDKHIVCSGNIEKDDTLRMLNAMKNFSGYSRIGATAIPYYLMPTTKEFNNAISKRQKQIRKKKDEPISLSVPERAEIVRRINNNA